MIKLLKKIIKKCTTTEQRKYIKDLYSHIKFKIKMKKNIIALDNYQVKIFEKKNRNVFNGYYDINPLNNDKLLVHCCKNSDKTNKNSIEIGWFNINNKKYHKISSTHAWCWQQGSRLRWSKEKNIVIYNDCIENNYSCIFFNIEEKKIVKKIDYALYDITKNEKIGLSLNFSRLQRLRPGYGYDVLEDQTINDNAPKDDGIFLIDILKNESKLIISLDELANLNDKKKEYQHYINHISISPSGKKFIFFHIYVTKTGWVTQLISADIDGKNIKVLENCDFVSHYTWKSDNEILITGRSCATNNSFYRIYDVSGKYKEDIDGIELSQDGHPTFFEKNIFVTDTYPINNYQRVFVYDITKKTCSNIIKLYADTRLVGEYRCDLHPKVDVKNDVIFIDSTMKKGKRAIIMIRGVIDGQKGK